MLVDTRILRNKLEELNSLLPSYESAWRATQEMEHFLTGLEEGTLKPETLDYMSMDDLKLMFDVMTEHRTAFRETCKDYIDFFVPDWAVEEEHFDCDLFAETYDQLGQPYIKYNITGIWRDENQNLVFSLDGEEVYIDFFRDEELLQLAGQL